MGAENVKYLDLPVHRRAFLKGLGLVGIKVLLNPLASLAFSPIPEIRLTPKNTVAEINRAINSSPNVPTRVILAAGHYSLPGSIFIRRSNLYLNGEGSEKTILRLNDGANAPMVHIGDAGVNFNGIEVTGIGFDGNKENQTDKEKNPRFVYAQNCTNLLLEDLNGVAGFEAGFSVEGLGENVRISRCQADDCNGVGFVMGGSGSIIEHSSSKGCIHGIQVPNIEKGISPQGVSVLYCTVVSPLSQGIVFEKDCHYGKAYHNTLQDCPNEGLTATENSGFEFVMNEVKGNTYLGQIVLSRASNGKVLSNFLRHNYHPKEDADGAAIILEGGCNKNEISGNFADGGRSGIIAKRNVDGFKPEGFNIGNLFAHNTIRNITALYEKDRGIGHSMSFADSPQSQVLDNDVDGIISFFDSPEVIYNSNNHARIFVDGEEVSVTINL